MNIQQFQYILAVAEIRHFELAAKACFVTQSTLSTMISKFEEEIGIQVFDRKRKPVQLTVEGRLIVEQLKHINGSIEQLSELSQELKGEVSGSLSLSVIPTIAPFLLPLFLQAFASQFPGLHIKVNEQTTSEILRQLKTRELDIGILSIPIHDKDLVELNCYDEPFVYFNAADARKTTATIQQVQRSPLVLMEEGHCMRTQIAKLCDLTKHPKRDRLNFEFKAGSIDSLLRFVRSNKASTLLPFLSTLDLSEQEKKHCSEFSAPVPYRSVGLVVHRHFAKKKLLQRLQNEIQNKVSPLIPKLKLSGPPLAPH